MRALVVGGVCVCVCVSARARVYLRASCAYVAYFKLFALKYQKGDRRVVEGLFELTHLRERES